MFFIEVTHPLGEPVSLNFPSLFAWENHRPFSRIFSDLNW
jgi:hypothetical protein